MAFNRENWGLNMAPNPLLNTIFTPLTVPMNMGSTMPKWDPRKVLNLQDTNGNFSCVGAANPAAKNSSCSLLMERPLSNSAAGILHNISYYNPWEVTANQLQMLTYQLLCKCHNHWGQIEPKVRQWQLRINEYLRPLDERLAMNEKIAVLQSKVSAQTMEIDERNERFRNAEANYEERQRTDQQYLDTLCHDLDSKDLRIINLEAEEEQRTHQLDAKDSRIRDLEAQISQTKLTFTRSLDEASHALSDSRANSNHRISELELQNTQLISQSHMTAFRNAVQILIIRKKYEHRLEMEKHTMSEQSEGLSRCLEDANKRLGAQDVSSYYIFICSAFMRSMMGGRCADSVLSSNSEC